MSYVIDAYKKPALIRRNILDIFLYISFFPQLIAGPIIRFEDIARQIDSRSVTAQNTVDGIQRFICGLAKKVLIDFAYSRISRLLAICSSSNSCDQ